VTVIKNTKGFIFGGFTSIPWSSSEGFKVDRTAFLFCFTNSSNTPLKLKVKSQEYAVYHKPTWMPTFGAGYDLHVSRSSNRNRESGMDLHSYELPNGKSGVEGGKFIVGDSDNNFQT